MEKFSIVIVILSILVGLSILIEKIRLPHPVVFVVAGLAIGFIPVLPDLMLDPDVVFIIFLPPLLYDAAFKTSWPDFKADIRPISALAVSLVFFTTVSVALAVYFFIPGFTWPLAFLVGAIVSPPDAVAATGIIKGLGLSKRVITILEGESLLNDASALIAYRYALLAVATGSFVFWRAGLQFLLVAGGGVAIGMIIGFLLVALHKRIKDNPAVETSLTLLTPFLSYLAAEKVHASGILAVVSTGLLISWKSTGMFSFQSRLQAKTVWNTLVFLLNGFVFILIGMQLPDILRQLHDYTFWQLAGYSVVVSVVTIIVRFLWVFAGAYSGRLFSTPRLPLFSRSKDEQEQVAWKNVLIISWTGTRGIISLAAALAIPVTLDDGKAFPQRPMILFLSFVVIFSTLVVQGLTLKPLIHLLGVKANRVDNKETRELQLYIARNTLRFIEQDLSDNTYQPVRDQLKARCEAVIRQFSSEVKAMQDAWDSEGRAPLPLTPLQLAQKKINSFQRGLLISLHQDGKFSDTAIKQVEHILDIDELLAEQHLAG